MDLGGQTGRARRLGCICRWLFAYREPVGPCTAYRRCWRTGAVERCSSVRCAFATAGQHDNEIMTLVLLWIVQWHCFRTVSCGVGRCSASRRVDYEVSTPNEHAAGRCSPPDFCLMSVLAQLPVETDTMHFSLSSSVRASYTQCDNLLECNRPSAPSSTRRSAHPPRRRPGCSCQP